MAIVKEMTGRNRAAQLEIVKHWELVMDREAWRAAFQGVAESDMTERLN